MTRAARVAALALLLGAPSAPASASIIVDSSDPRCASLGGPFPPGLDWIDEAAGTALVANFEPGYVVPVDFGVQPPRRIDAGALVDLRVAIGAAACNGVRSPQLDGVVVVSSELALVTTSSCEGVAFVEPLTRSLRDAEVSTPADTPPGTFLYLPAPGASATRAAVSTRMCVSLPPGARDSRGAAIPSGCRAGEPSYYTNFTSGAAVAAGRLFVSTSNLGAGAGTFDPQFLPGTVLVFDLSQDPLAVSPHPTTPALVTSAFNPTHVTSYRTPSGRELLLVGATGALGLVVDDPFTPYREAGGLALTRAAIDVIDPEQLRLVATIPLGLAALSFERLGIDPTGRVALIGSAVARQVFGVDLAPLDALAPDAPFVRLDGQDGPAAAIFDAEHPLVLPHLANGAPPETCPGLVVGVEFGGDGRTAYATDFCDGTITPIAVSLPASTGAPLARNRFRVGEAAPLVAPVGPASLGRAQAPGALRVRSATDGSDRIAALVGSPEGLACTVAAPVPEPGTAALGATATTMLTGIAVQRARRRRRHQPRNGGVK